MKGQYHGCQPGGRMRAWGPFSPLVAMILPGGSEVKPIFLVTTPIWSPPTYRNDANLKKHSITNKAARSPAILSSNDWTLTVLATIMAASTTPTIRNSADISYYPRLMVARKNLAQPWWVTLRVSHPQLVFRPNIRCTAVNI